MPRLFILEIGTRIRLTDDWSFGLHKERRNETVWAPVAASMAAEAARAEKRSQHLHAQAKWMAAEGQLPAEGYLQFRDRIADLQAQVSAALVLPVVLPAGPELTIDRLYVRKGISAYSSLTFYLTATGDPVLNVRGKKRFWARLADVNRITFELI